jgi:hypothetical protein
MTLCGYVRLSDVTRIDNLRKIAAQLEETAKNPSCPEVGAAFNSMARLVRERADISEEFLDGTSKYKIIRTVELD